MILKGIRQRNCQQPNVVSFNNRLLLSFVVLLLTNENLSLLAIQQLRTTATGNDNVTTTNNLLSIIEDTANDNDYSVGHQVHNNHQEEARAHRNLLFCFFFSWLSFCRKRSTNTGVSSIQNNAVIFTCSDSEQTIKSKNAANIRYGTSSTIYIGTNQVTGINQDPILIRFDTNGTMLWCQTTIEITGADGRGIGLLYGYDRLYAIFTTDGTQGATTEDFRRYTTNGWFTSYGQGGGPKVSVILQIDPNTGLGIKGTFLRAQLDNGNANTLVVTGIQYESSTTIKVSADSYFSPIKADKTRYNPNAGECSKTSSPFPYKVTLDVNLTTALATSC